MRLGTCTMRRRNVTFLVLVVFLCWNAMTYFLVANRSAESDVGDLEMDDVEAKDVHGRLAVLQKRIKDQVDMHESLLKDLEDIRNGLVLQLVPNNSSPNGKKVMDHGLSVNGDQIPKMAIKDEELDKITLPILVIACNRVTVSRNLDLLLKYRPSAERFPIVVSQDCGHKQTADVIRSYGSKVTHLQHPDLSDIPLSKKDKKFQGYYKIARHYKWAYNQIFNTLGFDAVITVEDDLDISPDFFEYFAATFRILKTDPTLWCVSAWNDNGKENMVSNEAELLYRTDFFPGLGWMMAKDVWMELEDKWPPTFWDDWMRNPEQRKGRSCIRPEISRTKTFGKVGVSKGQYFEKHLKFIKLNDVFVPFTQKDLSYLMKSNYDEKFAKIVYGAPLLNIGEVLRNERKEENVIRVQYNDKLQFKTMAKQLGIMEDLKSGVPRAGYRGIVSFYKDSRRVFFAPPPDWKAYDPTWS